MNLSEVQKFHYQPKPIGSDGMESTGITCQKGFRGLTRPSFRTLVTTLGINKHPICNQIRAEDRVLDTGTNLDALVGNLAL